MEGPRLAPRYWMTVYKWWAHSILSKIKQEGGGGEEEKNRWNRVTTPDYFLIQEHFGRLSMIPSDTSVCPSTAPLAGVPFHGRTIQEPSLGREVRVLTALWRHHLPIPNFHNYNGKAENFLTHGSSKSNQGKEPEGYFNICKASDPQ